MHASEFSSSKLSSVCVCPSMPKILPGVPQSMATAKVSCEEMSLAPLFCFSLSLHPGGGGGGTQDRPRPGFPGGGDCGALLPAREQ